MIAARIRAGLIAESKGHFETAESERQLKL
jgi:hypothetical protein